MQHEAAHSAVDLKALRPVPPIRVTWASKISEVVILECGFLTESAECRPASGPLLATPWAPLGPPWVPLWLPLDPSWAPAGLPLDPPGPPLGSLWAPGASQVGLWTPPGHPLGCPWTPLGLPWAPFGPPMPPNRCILVQFWCHFGAFCGAFLGRVEIVIFATPPVYNHHF